MVTIDPEDETDLTNWVRRAVAPLIDTSPESLTNFVLVLLKTNTSLADTALENKCRTELEYFLKDKADAFVDSLFETIRSGSFKYQHQHQHQHSDEGVEEETAGGYGEEEEEEVAGGGYGGEAYYEEEEAGHGGGDEEGDSVDGGRRNDGYDDRRRRGYEGESDDEDEEDREWERGDRRRDGRSRSRSPSPPTTSSERAPSQPKQQQQQKQPPRRDKAPFTSMPPRDRDKRELHNNNNRRQQQQQQHLHPHQHQQQNWNRGGGGHPPRGVNGQLHPGGGPSPGPGMHRPFPGQEGPRGPDPFNRFGPPPPQMPTPGRPPFPPEPNMFMGRPPPNMMGQPMPMPPFGAPPIATGTMRMGSFNRGPPPQGYAGPMPPGPPRQPQMGFGGEGSLRLGGPGAPPGMSGSLMPGMGQPRPPQPGPPIQTRPMPHQGGGGGGASWPVAPDFNRDRIVPMPLEPPETDRGRHPPPQQQQQPPPQQRGIKRPADEMRKGGPPLQQQRLQQERPSPKGPPSAQPPVQDTEKTTLRVSMIPKDVNIGLLESHCKQFGRVMELRLRPQQGAFTSEGQPCNQAFVQFATFQQARQCLTSPASVANNRFIVVEWAQSNLLPPDQVAAILESDKQQQQQQSQQQPHPPEAPGGGGSGGGAAVQDMEGTGGDVTAPPWKLQVPPSRQEAKLSNAKAELLRKQLEISRQKEALLTKQLALERTSLDKAIARHGEGHEEVAKIRANMGNTEAMLQQAKEEVASLAEAAAVQVTLVAPGFRGGMRGGMRGGPGGGRAQRGGGRFGAAARGPMRIDNRTTCLKLLNRPEDYTEAMLLSFFGTYGSVEKITLEGDAVAIIKYAARHMAEKAMASAKVLGDIQLMLEWYDPRLAGGGGGGPEASTRPAEDTASSSEGPSSKVESTPGPYGLDEVEGLEDELDYQAYYEDLPNQLQGIA